MRKMLKTKDETNVNALKNYVLLLLLHKMNDLFT